MIDLTSQDAHGQASQMASLSVSQLMSPRRQHESSLLNGAGPVTRRQLLRPTRAHNLRCCAEFNVIVGTHKVVTPFYVVT